MSKFVTRKFYIVIIFCDVGNQSVAGVGLGFGLQSQNYEHLENVQEIRESNACGVAPIRHPNPQGSYAAWKRMAKIREFLVWKIPEAVFWSVSMEKENNFPDLVFWHTFS